MIKGRVSAQGTSRGGADMRRIAESIGSRRIDMVFVVGGNGGNAGANAIYRECFAINVICSVIALPKSIDNDLLLVSYYLQSLPVILHTT